MTVLYMTADTHLCYLPEFFLQRDVLQTDVVEKIKQRGCVQ